MAVKKRLAYAAGVSWVARPHGATLHVGCYVRSVREALSPARASSAGELRQVGVC